jgi:hypothetical protein
MMTQRSTSLNGDYAPSFLQQMEYGLDDGFEWVEGSKKSGRVLMIRVLDGRPLQYARDLFQLNGSRNYL